LLHFNIIHYSSFNIHIFMNFAIPDPIQPQFSVASLPIIHFYHQEFLFTSFFYFPHFWPV
jgi:hypothetical protein